MGNLTNVEKPTILQTSHIRKGTMKKPAFWVTPSQKLSILQYGEILKKDTTNISVFTGWSKEGKIVLKPLFCFLNLGNDFTSLLKILKESFDFKYLG